MKHIFTILTFLIAFQANSQNYIKNIDSFDSWAGQAKYDYELLTRFENYCRENNLLTGIISMLDAQNHNLRDYTSAIDLNNDGQKDVVYNGTSGGEPNIVYFFLQKDKGFEQIFEVMQGVTKVIWEGELLSQIYTSDWGCCSTIHLINSVYNVTYNQQNKPTFSKVFQSIEVNNELTKPKNYFSTPIEFVVENEGYKLRLHPKIDDTTEYHWLEITGNTFANLRQGTKGTALASRTDETGRIWWYVAINLDENVQKCILHKPEDFQTKVIGWISSRYVTKIEN